MAWIIKPIKVGAIASIKAFYLWRISERLLETLDKEVNENHKILEQIQFSDAVKIIKEPCWNPFVTVWSQP